MAERPRAHYQTPPPSPPRSPPHRDPDISPPEGSRASHVDLRSQRASSSSGHRHSSRNGDTPRDTPGSRYAATRAFSCSRDEPRNTQGVPRDEAWDVRPLRSLVPSVLQENPLPPPPAIPSRGKYVKA
ncbi:hypothetical protein MKX03_024949, partial [Papaver bracteatum]